MSDSIQTQGKTVNDAVSEALLQLGLRRDEVEIKVIEEPKSGLFGFIGGRAARVMVRKKPARRGGRGRNNNRSGDNQAHSLSGGGRSRGGRGRGGRRDQNQQQGGGEARTASRDGGKGTRDEGRKDSGGGSRGRRGGRGRDNRGQDSRGQDNRNQDNRNQEGKSQANKSQTNRSQDNRNQDNRNQDNRNSAKKPQEAKPQDNNRRGGRGRGRAVKDDQQVTVERAEVKTSRSRRGSRGGRGRNRNDQGAETRRDESSVTRETNASAQVAPDRAPEAITPTRKATVAADVSASTPNTKEKTSMTNDAQKPTPAATETSQVQSAPAAAEAPAPVVKPKAKRKGWGGGLGSRLPRKANPTVKNKPEPRVIADAPAPPAAAAPRRVSRDDSRSRDGYRERRPSSAPEEVIIDAVAATKYAKPIEAVNDENLDASLAELASGMLARAGFPCEVVVNEGEYRQVLISSDEESAGMLIGRHGQTVDAVEHLVERMACNAVDDRVRMNLDINGYRLRRLESLQERVAEAVAEVRASGKAYHVEPMSARERRLVHLEVEPLEGVRTYTMIGSGGKYVVIALGDEPDEGSPNAG